jgi:hypothetical protein
MSHGKQTRPVGFVTLLKDATPDHSILMIKNIPSTKETGAQPRVMPVPNLRMW